MLISIKKRLLLLFVAILFFLGIFFVGFSFKMDESFSKELSKNFINQIKDIDEFGIFFNNLKIALVMFIPVIGIIMGTISGFSTGLVFNSIMDVSSPTSYSNPLIIFLTPFGILELLSYGLAISRGGILFFELIKKKFTKKSLIYLLVEVALVGIMLFTGAIIEWVMIENIPRKV
ncbi:stage II sporulation protein M [Candidatus Nitrosocosmicus hydrocola]|uniref:stage II sporulation protein M n=1 Tax=Candidatus Nitrosocosmicus hydrocola TaxID=1826872 RepID=UPI0011E5E051|nr:stage II sporulation protein M [Candidatus Nitrosocosmicus hydrocola]